MFFSLEEINIFSLEEINIFSLEEINIFSLEDINIFFLEENVFSLEEIYIFSLEDKNIFSLERKIYSLWKRNNCLGRRISMVFFSRQKYGAKRWCCHCTLFSSSCVNRKLKRHGIGGLVGSAPALNGSALWSNTDITKGVAKK
jgi:hypothetical protein